MANLEEVIRKIAEGAGQSALSVILPGGLKNAVMGQGSPTAAGISPASSIGNSLTPFQPAFAAEPGSRLNQTATATAESPAPKGQVSKEQTQPKGKGKFSFLGDAMSQLGSGLVEGALGMPSSSQSIAAAVGRLPGDVIRTKIGLQTSGEARKEERGFKIAEANARLSRVGKLSQEQYDTLGQEISLAPVWIKNILSSPAVMAKYGIRSEEDAKRVIMQRLIDKYGVDYTSKIKSGLGIKSSIDDLTVALAGMYSNPGE